MSTLERLYTYAKSVGAGARENFTTEALAGAMRDDPAPMLRVLGGAGLLPPGTVLDVALDTQVVLPGTGILDLVIRATIAGEPHELWCEVKVEAGESGLQLDAYRRHLAGLPAPLRPILFTLGPKPLRDDPSIPFISWHKLRRAVGHRDSAAWRDFVDYLAEVRMSDDFDQPISAREAGSLDDFRSLHGKVARILAETGDLAIERWPGLGWARGEQAIRKRLFDRFASHQQLALGASGAKANSSWVVYGAIPADGETQLMVAVETWPAAADLQRTILDQADRAGLGPEWKRALGAWGGIKRTERLVLLGDVAGGKAWLVDRLAELDKAGILALVAARGLHSAE